MMNYLIGYGSLIHPNETKRHIFTPNAVEPARIFGFERVFDQKATSRKTNGNKAAVLNIYKKRNSWINAVLLGGFEDSYFEELDERESGYDKIKLSVEDVYPYNGLHVNKEDTFFIYIGKQGAQDNTLLPIKEYLELCLEGAMHYGELFYKDFVETTYIGSKKALKDYLI